MIGTQYLQVHENKVLASENVISALLSEINLEPKILEAEA